jgi:hypothetical protein
MRTWCGIVVCKIPMRISRILALGSAVFAVAAGCAHSGRPAGKDAIVHDDVTKMTAFLTGIPGCSTEEGAIALGELNPEAPPPRRVRGFLVRDAGHCTLMACNHECCNKCNGAWTLAASKAGDAPVLLLSPALPWHATDCSLPSLKAKARGVEVIVTGTMSAGDAEAAVVHPTNQTISYSALCATH